MGSCRKEKRKPKPKRKGKEENENSSWSRLPLDIVANIFRLLPLNHAIKAKAVCRQWCTLLDSILQQPQSLLVHGDILMPVFLPNRRRSPWIGYHAVSHTWRRFPSLSFHPFNVQRFHSSHNGLLLLEESPSRVYVCNFCTHQYRLLPPVTLMPYSSNTIYWYHLKVNEDRETYSVMAMVRSSSHWPQLVLFDSRHDEWSPLQIADSSNVYFPSVFFEDIQRLVVLPESIYTVVNGKYSGTWYLIEYQILGGAWVLVCKLHVTSAQIVSFKDTFMVVTLDGFTSRQIHLHRFEGRQLLLEATTGPELADFVVDCANHYWYTAGWNSCIYVGEREGSKAVVEYNAVSKSWKCLPLPDIPEEYKEDYTAACVCEDAYELGITTEV